MFRGEQAQRMSCGWDINLITRLLTNIDLNVLRSKPSFWMCLYIKHTFILILSVCETGNPADAGANGHVLLDSITPHRGHGGG